MSPRASWSWLLAGALFLAVTDARAQVATDPLTGSTPDFGAALGGKAYEPVYFDAGGNVTDNPAEAVKYAITDNVQGMSTLPKPISQMTPEDRQKLGLATPPAEKTAAGDKIEQTKNDKPAPGKPQEKPSAPAPERDAEADAATEAGRSEQNSQIVEGTQVTDPSGLVYGDVKPQLVQAAMDSYAPTGEGGSPSNGGGRADAFGIGESPAHAFVAPAVASQVRVIEPGGASPRGYRALNTLVGLRDTLVVRIQTFLGEGSEAGLAGYGIVYDGAAAKASPAFDTRPSDSRFGVAQHTVE